MELTLLRYNKQNGIAGLMLIDGMFVCHTVEPMNHIPTGRYRIKLRTTSSKMNKQYAKKFGDLHKGMLWLQDVTGREWIYLHYGNEPANSDGCVLTGASAMERVTSKSGGEKVVFTGSSVDTYEDIYEEISDALIEEEDVFITITEVATLI